MTFEELLEKYRAVLIENSNLKEEIETLKSKLGVSEHRAIPYGRSDNTSEDSLFPTPTTFIKASEHRSEGKTLQSNVNCMSDPKEKVILFRSLFKGCNVGSWNVKNVEVEKKLKGFDFYAAKDIKMAEEADYGFMIWNGKSKGTLNNVINITNRNKKTLIYFTPGNEFHTIKSLADIESIICQCDEETKKIFLDLSSKNAQLVKEEINNYIIEEQLLF